MLKANAEKEEARKAKAMQETAELMKLISGESAEIPEDVRKILNEIEEEKPGDYTDCDGGRSSPEYRGR